MVPFYTLFYFTLYYGILCLTLYYIRYFIYFNLYYWILCFAWYCIFYFILFCTTECMPLYLSILFICLLYLISISICIMLYSMRYSV